MTSKFVSLFLILGLIACLFVGESMANKNKGEDDIILYNGNIVLRGSGKKGKGRGSIVVANSPQMDYSSMFGGFGRRK